MIACAGSARAQEAAALALPDVVVSATGTPTPAEHVGSSVTVITADQLERAQLRTVPDALKTVPGLNVVQTGGPGGQTSVFIRGTNSNQVKVLIDGVEASDPSTPNGAFDFGQLLTADVARIEVLRGPQSGLYGSDAIGGVISVTTKKGEGPARFTGMVEGGSFGTFNQAVGVSGSAHQLSYAFNVAHYSSSDTPVTPANIAPAGWPLNPNTYDNWTYSTRLDGQLSDSFAVNFIARYTSSQLGYTPDIYPPPFYEGLPALERSTSFARQFITKGEGVWTALDGNLVSTFGVSAVDLSRPTVGPNEDVNGTYDGDRQTYYARSNITFLPGQSLLVGVERKEESMTSSTAYSELTANTGSTGVYAELQLALGDRFFLAANVRNDDDDSFGSHATWRIAPAFLIPETGTKLKASYGTGFKAPSLYQLYAPYYGNAELKPEESEGYDIGFEQQVFGGRVSFGATWFHNDITNLISYDPATYVNINVSSARTQGVEAFVAVAVTDRLNMRFDYTYTDAIGYLPVDAPFGASCAPLSDTTCTLLRRPNNKFSITADWKPIDPLTLSASLVYVSSWWDIVRFTSDYVDQPGYTVVNLAANYQLNQNATVFGRIDNLFDERYENPNGFLATGLGAFGGIRLTY
ncbi:TonB-dependent receptor [Azorhizobium oxalatiphilum]|uniref:TonB-dependent receptor n=1 Tax=Azorhizobium oxalatiphilum TaxID=980631 RepID=A0A917C5U0_9HYPH|nr:TonB-dependent receptor [Azorhizobium oxalatiphilum]GGF70452.1 TonB-dependent receptor [Azorhizobium oxalatiphilum]